MLGWADGRAFSNVFVPGTAAGLLTLAWFKQSR